MFDQWCSNMRRHLTQHREFGNFRKIFSQQMAGCLAIMIQLLCRAIVKRKQFGRQGGLLARPLWANFAEGLWMPQPMRTLQKSIQHPLALSQPHFTAARCSRRR